MPKRLIPFLAATAAIFIATPAAAAITFVAASSGQGTLVHGDGGGADTGLTIQGLLGANGPKIVNFDGDTDETLAPADILRIQQGGGQADVTGAEISNNSTYNLLSGNIYLTGFNMGYIEFALTGDPGGSVNFFVRDNNDGISNFSGVIGSGNTFFAFDATDGSSIENVFYQVVGGTEIDILKQVRIETAPIPSAVPEPGTWAMMLIGFGAIGVGMRRRKRAVVQAA